MSNKPYFLALTLVCLNLAYITAGHSTSTATPSVIKETYVSAWNDSLDIDSVVVFHHDDAYIVIATAKQADKLFLYDAITGQILGEASGSGVEAGHLERPNGIARNGNLLFVVERDNRRVQVFNVPSFTHRGFVGEGILNRPYGIYVDARKHVLRLYVTDNYETPDEKVPPESELDRRICVFTVETIGDTLSSSLVSRFGDTSGSGVLRTVESIAGEPSRNRLLIADEHKQELDVKVYDYDGRFTGIIVGKGIFHNQPEGIAWWPLDDNEGYWIMTDQGAELTTFHVFDGESFSYVTSFTGKITANTDGIALTTESFGPFTEGALIAVHNDGGISAFSLSEVRSLLH